MCCWVVVCVGVGVFVVFCVIWFLFGCVEC